MDLYSEIPALAGSEKQKLRRLYLRLEPFPILKEMIP